MSDALAWFNGLPRDDVERRLLACCASRTWASRVAAGRPYSGVEALMEAGDAVWSALRPADRLEAFAAHPRLGQTGGHSPDTSRSEQTRVMGAGEEILAQLAEENLRYEARFGHVFLMSASGRTAGAVLAALRNRMGNDPATEIAVAAEEQRKITRLRLERMLHG